MNTDFKIDKDKLTITMSRVFDAPRDKVWQAHVDPKLIEQWWGSRKYSTIVEKLDARVGGAWKFINSDYRQKGVGRRLMHAVEQKARDSNCYRIYIETHHTHKQAHKFYEALRYTNYGYHFIKNLNS